MMNYFVLRVFRRTLAKDILITLVFSFSFNRFIVSIGCILGSFYCRCIKEHWLNEVAANISIYILMLDSFLLCYCWVLLWIEMSFWNISFHSSGHRIVLANLRCSCLIPKCKVPAIPWYCLKTTCALLLVDLSHFFHYLVISNVFSIFWDQLMFYLLNETHILSLLLSFYLSHVLVNWTFNLCNLVDARIWILVKSLWMPPSLN